jgi:oligopeptide/dipeptide ABC transporter ATP-binding protein
MGLLKCIPRLDEEEGKKLVPIEGLPPNLINMPPTCAFLPRCSWKIKKCYQEPWPELTPVNSNHFIRCYADTKEKK